MDYYKMKNTVLILLADRKYHSSVEISKHLNVRMQEAYSILKDMMLEELVDQSKGIDNSRIKPNKWLRSRVNIYKLTDKGAEYSKKVLAGEVA